MHYNSPGVVEGTSKHCEAPSDRRVHNHRRHSVGALAIRGRWGLGVRLDAVDCVSGGWRERVDRGAGQRLWQTALIGLLVSQPCALPYSSTLSFTSEQVMYV